MKKLVSTIFFTAITMIFLISASITSYASSLQHHNKVPPKIKKKSTSTLASTKVKSSTPASAKTIDIDKTSNGKTITINKGDSLRIVLYSNGTTGYRWDIEPFSSEGILKLTSQKFTLESNAIGAGGQDEFIFQGDSKGSTNLSLKWQYSSEKIASTFSVTVNVQDESSAKTITIDETSNGKTITINKGDFLKIVLDANGAGGYRWDVDSIPRNGVLKSVSQDVIPPTSDAIGDSCKDQFIFKCDKVGSAKLTLKYSQGSSEEIASTFSVTVDVK